MPRSSAVAFASSGGPQEQALGPRGLSSRPAITRGERRPGAVGGRSARVRLCRFTMARYARPGLGEPRATGGRRRHGHRTGQLRARAARRRTPSQRGRPSLRPRQSEATFLAVARGRSSSSCSPAAVTGSTPAGRRTPKGVAARRSPGRWQLVSSRVASQGYVDPAPGFPKHRSCDDGGGGANRRRTAASKRGALPWRVCSGARRGGTAGLANAVGGEAGALLCAVAFDASWAATGMVIVELYTVALLGDRQRSLVIGAVTAIVVVVAIVLIDSSLELTAIGLRLLLVFASLALGDTVRSRRALRAAAQERGIASSANVRTRPANVRLRSACGSLVSSTTPSRTRLSRSTCGPAWRWISTTPRIPLARCGTSSRSQPPRCTICGRHSAFCATRPTQLRPRPRLTSTRLPGSRIARGLPGCTRT